MAKVALLRTAEEVFAEKGLEGARVEEIAKRAGVSKGAFYLHFESKEEAFRQVVESFLARCSALVQEPESFATLPTTPEEMLDFIYEHDLATFEYLWQSRAFIQIVDNCTGDHKYLLDSFLDHTQKNSERWIRTWKDAGLFRSNVDARVAATMICGGYRELVRRMVTAPKKPPIASWLRDAQRLLVYGLGNETLRRAQERRDEEEARSSTSDAKHRSTGETARTP